MQNEHVRYAVSLKTQMFALTNKINILILRAIILTINIQCLNCECKTKSITFFREKIPFNQQLSLIETRMEKIHDSSSFWFKNMCWSEFSRHWRYCRVKWAIRCSLTIQKQTKQRSKCDIWWSFILLCAAYMFIFMFIYTTIRMT